MRRIGAPRANARTRLTRCCMPPDSSFGRDLAKGASPTCSSSAIGSLVGSSGMATREPARNGHGGRPTSRSSVTFSTTDRHGSSAGVCGTRPKRFAARASSGVASSMRTLPPSGAISPPMMRRSVDLPQPLGPMTLTNSPAVTERLTSRSATTGLPLWKKCFWT